MVIRCQAATPSGLEGCFRELYDGYKDRVYNICYRITGNGNDALDAAQETFGILFRKIEGFRFQSKFSSWVYRIAVNASIDLKRRAANRRLPSLDQLSDSRTGEAVRIAASRSTIAQRVPWKPPRPWSSNKRSNPRSPVSLPR